MKFGAWCSFLPWPESLAAKEIQQQYQLLCVVFTYLYCVLSLTWILLHKWNTTTLSIFVCGVTKAFRLLKSIRGTTQSFRHPRRTRTLPLAMAALRASVHWITSGGKALTLYIAAQLKDPLRLLPHEGDSRDNNNSIYCRTFWPDSPS